MSILLPQQYLTQTLWFILAKKKYYFRPNIFEKYFSLSKQNQSENTNLPTTKFSRGNDKIWIFPVTKEWGYEEDLTVRAPHWGPIDAGGINMPIAQSGTNLTTGPMCQDLPDIDSWKRSFYPVYERNFNVIVQIPGPKCSPRDFTHVGGNWKCECCQWVEISTMLPNLGSNYTQYQGILQLYGKSNGASYIPRINGWNSNQNVHSSLRDESHDGPHMSGFAQYWLLANQLLLNPGTKFQRNCGHTWV